MIQAAWAAIRKKDSYLRAQFLRLRTRRGTKKAIGAVAASILPPPTTSFGTEHPTATSARSTSRTVIGRRAFGAS